MLLVIMMMMMIMMAMMMLMVNLSLLQLMCLLTFWLLLRQALTEKRDRQKDQQTVTQLSAITVHFKGKNLSH